MDVFRFDCHECLNSRTRSWSNERTEQIEERIKIGLKCLISVDSIRQLLANRSI